MTKTVAALALLASLASASAVRGQVYTRRNANGVVEATNVPDSPGFNLTYPGKGTLIHSRGFQRNRAYWSMYDHHVDEAARLHQVSSDLVKAVIAAESEFDQWAVSSKGARGLMQLMPDTARRLGVGDSFDARQNIFDGTFGKATAAAIRTFQRTNGLPENGALNDELVYKIYEAAGRPTPPEGHLFVRQGFSRVFDAPIAFRKPNEPLGTHFYAALPFPPGASKARWVAFSWEGGDAAKALDRLEIPDDVRREISQRLTPGSSLIVADTSVDSAILPEGDDFLVWANEEPAKVEPPKVKQADREIKQASRERSKAKQTASSRAAVRQTQSDNWSRPARRNRREPLPDFYAPRFFSRW